MNKPLLSICIATYNRARYIGETLNSIIPQLDDDVELLVVDGASTDGTGDVVQKYDDPGLRYIRLPVKGGVDQDYCRAVELARGQYCWLFTDDDLLRPGAVAAVKKAITAGYGIVIVNAEIRNRTLDVILAQQRISMREDRFYSPEDTDRLFVDTLPCLSFIGALVIRRTIWMEREQSPYLGTEFVHIGVVFQRPLAGPVLVLAEPYVVIRYGNAQWRPRSFEVWMFKWPKLVWSFDHVSEQAKAQVSGREPWRDLTNLVFQRSVGAYTVESYRSHLSNIETGALWKVSAWLIAVFPRTLIIGLHYLYSRIKGSESRAYFDADHATE